MEASEGPAAGLANNVLAVRRALESAGVIFVDRNGEGPGVRLKIFADGNELATLHHSGKAIPGPTLGEAVIAWHNLPPEVQKAATIKVESGPEYSADEIDRLYQRSRTRPASG
jgi:hypothetical protein